MEYSGDRIEIPLPTEDARKEILNIYNKQKPIDNTVDMKKMGLTEI